MGVSLVGQAKVAGIARGVDRLLHRAQQHRVDLRCVRPVLGGQRDRLQLGRLGVVAQTETQAQRAQVVLQGHPFFGRRPLVHPKQRRVFVAFDELGGTDVGRQHRFLDQPVRLGAGARNDLLDAAVVVADDLGLGALKINRTALAPLLEQGAVDLVQVQQMRHQISPALGLDTPGIAQDIGHLGVGQPGV